MLDEEDAIGDPTGDLIGPIVRGCVDGDDNLVGILTGRRCPQL
jgi:hypothetical protein